MRTTEDIAKELFARKAEGGYVRAMIVASYDREELLYHNLIKAEDGYDVVVDRLSQVHTRRRASDRHDLCHEA